MNRTHALAYLKSSVYLDYYKQTFGSRFGSYIDYREKLSRVTDKHSVLLE